MTDNETLVRTNPFAGLLGVRFLEVTPKRVRAQVTVREDMCTAGNVLHGGALMSLADTAGAYIAVLNLPPGAGTTTLESKTNFFAPAPAGAAVTAEAEPLHVGRRTIVARTQITSEAGKLLAVVTQTQMVLEPPKQSSADGAQDPQQQLAALFAGKPIAEQKALLAQLERAGASLYKSWASAEPDERTKAALLEPAEREEANARVLEGGE